MCSIRLHLLYEASVNFIFFCQWIIVDYQNLLRKWSVTRHKAKSAHAYPMSLLDPKPVGLNKNESMINADIIRAYICSRIVIYWPSMVEYCCEYFWMQKYYSFTRSKLNLETQNPGVNKTCRRNLGLQQSTLTVDHISVKSEQNQMEVQHIWRADKPSMRSWKKSFPVKQEYVNTYTRCMPLMSSYYAYRHYNMITIARTLIHVCYIDADSYVAPGVPQ